MMGKACNICPGEMTDIDVDFVSLVDKGANKQNVQIYKAEDGADTENERTVNGFMAAMRNFFVGKSAESKQEEQSIVNTNAQLEKAGRVLSGKNVALIKDAITALQGLLGGIEDAVEQADVKKGDDENMTSEEIKDIVKNAVGEAIKPLTEKVDELEKSTKADDEVDDNDLEKVLEKFAESVVAEAIKPLQERINSVEKSRGMTKSLDDNSQKSDVEKSEGIFDGLFI